jgi:Sec-independent protein secretion pathway component TatC
MFQALIHFFSKFFVCKNLYNTLYQILESTEMVKENTKKPLRVQISSWLEYVLRLVFMHSLFLSFSVIYSQVKTVIYHVSSSNNLYSYLQKDDSWLGTKTQQAIK